MSDFIGKESDYAIRIVAYMLGVKRRVKVAELTENLFITKSIVVKITQELKKCGILTTKTGKHGGLMLNKGNEDITIYRVLKCMGFKSGINVCAVKPSECMLNPICSITTYFAEMQKNIINELKKAEIKDFVFNEDEIKELKKSINTGG